MARIISWSYWCTDSIKDCKDGSSCQRWRWSNGVQVVRSLGEEEGKSWQLDPLVILARPLGSAWQCQRHPRLIVSCLKTKGVFRRCSQDQRRFQTCLETSVFRRELSLNGCLQTWHVFRHVSEDIICLGTAVSRQYLSGDISRLKTLVSRHITSGNTRLKTVYVLRVYISAPRTPLTFSKCILLICTEYRSVLASAIQSMFSNLQGGNKRY